MRNTQANRNNKRLFSLFAGITTGSSLLLASFEYRAFETKPLKYEPIVPKPVTIEYFIPPVPEKPTSLPKAITPKLKDLSDIIQVEPDLVEPEELLEENVDGVDGLVELDSINGANQPHYGTDLVEEVEALYFPEIIATYGNCDGIDDYQEKLNCTQANVTTYIQQNVKYNLDMIRVGAQGIVAVEYVIDEDGNVKDVTLLRGVHKNLDQQVMNAISNMGRWKPARQGPHKVKQRYITSVKFQLN